MTVLDWKLGDGKFILQGTWILKTKFCDNPLNSFPDTVNPMVALDRRASNSMRNIKWEP